MKVRALMQLLAAHDPDADVFLVSQPHWPHEHHIADVVSRAAVTEQTGVVWRGNDETLPTDVLITEGAWQRYGCPETWKTVGRSHDTATRTANRRK